MDLRNARPDPNWEQKKEEGWTVLARETLGILQAQENFGEYPTEERLANALKKANAQLTWKEVPNNARQSSPKKFRKS